MTQSKVKIGNISKISGEVNIASGNIVKSIRTIYERSLTSAEEADKARSLENKLLADGVGSYLQRLQQQVKSPRKNASPYKGLLEYRLEDAQAFFGRNTAIHDLLTVIDRGPLTILHAESGAGKTSLLQAGIIPRVLAHGHLPITLRPYNKLPSQALKRAFLPDLDQSPFLAKAPLREFLGRVSKIIGPKTSLYVFMDQLEEFFNQIDQKEQKIFIEDLAECLDDTSLNVHWLISLRTEYHGRLGNFQPRIRNVYENDYLLNRLTRDEARLAITEPAERLNIKFDKGLTERIIDELCKDKEEITPPQLQLVCSALFETLRPGENLISTKIYEREGGAGGILQGHLERVLKRLKPEERVTAHQIMESLVTSVQRRSLRSRTELIRSLSARGIKETELQNTIDQLVESRLLRVEENNEGPAYELAHDYLLGEIDMSSDVKSRKQAEELLEQCLSNWRNHQLLIAPDAQEVIEKQKAHLIISSESARILFLSAIEHRRSGDEWADLISAKERDVLINAYLREDNTQKSRAGLWSLRRYLTSLLRIRVTTLRLSLRLVTFLWKILLILLVSALGFILLFTLINGTSKFVNWTEISNLSAQCLNGHQPSLPLVAIDTANGSHVTIFDRGSKTLCETHTTGAEWMIVDASLALSATIKSIAVNKDIYILTDQGIIWKTQNSNWATINFPDEAQLSFQKIAIAPNQRIIYAVNNQNLIYAYDTITKQWNNYPLRGVTGIITDMTVNSWYLAISTTEGIWYQSTNEPGKWKNFNYRILKQPTIVSIGMYRIAPSWGGSMVNLMNSDRLLALTKMGELYSAYLTEERGLELLSTPFSHIPPDGNPSLAVNLDSNFAIDATGVFCKQTWTILEVEWWKYLFSENKPCQ